MNWSSPLVIEAGVFGAAIVLILAVALLLPQLPTIRHLLLGVQVPPAIVGYMRLLISAFGGLVVTWLLARVSDLNGTGLAAVGIPLTGIIHGLWGLLDQSLKPGANDERPPSIAGGLTVDEAGGVDPHADHGAKPAQP